MAIGLQNQANITAPDSIYPNGQIRDKTPSLPGTAVNRKVYNDIHQFFAKLLRIAVIVPSNLPENEYSGFQYITALRSATPYYLSWCYNMVQAGSFDPSYFQFPTNGPGVIVWVRTGTGVYTGTLSGAFTVSNTQIFITGSSTGVMEAVRTSTNVITISTYDFTGAPADGIMTNTNVEVRVYR